MYAIRRWVAAIFGVLLPASTSSFAETMKCSGPGCDGGAQAEVLPPNMQPRVVCFVKNGKYCNLDDDLFRLPVGTAWRIGGI